MELTELRNRLVAARGQKSHHQDITNEDILVAAKKLKVFGNGFTVIPVGKNKHMVQSIPGELSLQDTSILTLASNQGEGYVTIDMLIKDLWYIKLF